MNSTHDFPRRMLALGDSYTIGEKVGIAERWPMLLVARLRADGIVADDPTVIAMTGWTTDELSAAIDRADPKGPFDCVTLLIGVNNQYRGRGVDEYRIQFRELLMRAITFAGGNALHVIVVSIPDWGVMPFAEGRDRAAIARDIDAFNVVNYEVSHRAGTHYVDVTPISRRAATDPALIAEDGLHPSGAQYAAWTDLIEPVALSILSHAEQP